MYERHGQPLLSRRLFVRRVVRSLAAGALIITVSLSVGMLGYHWLENMRWIDAFANAAMILSGMGPLEPLKTDGGKLFAGLYAIYSGLAVILIAGVVFAPVVHRFLHRFHLEPDSRK
ncbi:MAG: hypothetical protein E6H56_01195 [Betaproteobacteria bacterium]|jgi:hypothetical protein|nr:MAG: hypothetical protein E6H56_01195 [Betaproteobacteria bacterium]